MYVGQLHAGIGGGYLQGGAADPGEGDRGVAGVEIRLREGGIVRRLHCRVGGADLQTGGIIRWELYRHLPGASVKVVKKAPEKGIEAGTGRGG